MFITDNMFDEMDEEILNFLSSRSSHADSVPADAPRIDLFQEGRYAAYAHDLGFGWRWAITRDGREIQEGPALSRDSAQHSARRVLLFFTQVDDAGSA